MAEADLSKIVSVIMENPDLIEQIKNTVMKSEYESESNIQTEAQKEEAPKDARASERIAKDSPYSKSRAEKRNELLRAIRPYLSEPRGRAIETMITVADILFAVKEK